MIDFILTSILINSFTCFVLIVFLLISGNKYKYFTLFNLSLLFWNTFYGLSIKTTVEADSLLFNHLCSFFGTFVGYLAFNFAVELCEIKISKRIRTINTTLVIFFALLMLTPVMIKGVKPFMDFNFIPVMGYAYYIFILHYSMNAIAAHVILYKNLEFNPKTKFVFIGFIIGFTGGTTAILPYFGIPLYPVAMIAMSIYCPLITYAIIKHRLFDTTIIVSSLIARFVAMLILGLLYFALITSYEVLIPFTKDKTVILTVVSLLYLIFCLESYQILIKKLRSAQDKIIKKPYEYELLSKKIIEELSNVVDTSDLVKTTKLIFTEQLKIKVKALYIDQGWILNKNEKELSKIFGDEIDEDLLKIISSQTVNLPLPITYEEANVHLKRVLVASKTSCIIPLIFSNNFLGFLLVEARNKNHYFSYDDLMLFDNLTFQVGAALDRIRFHFRSLEQEKIIHEEKLKFTKSLAGSIAHELRNPLNAINLLGSQINNLISKLDETKKDKIMDSIDSSVIDTKSEVIGLTSDIRNAISSANNIIDIVLSDLSEKPIKKTDFKYLTVKTTIENIISKYGYKSELEKTKIKVNIDSKSSFIFKAAPDRFDFIIYNLLKNAFYYLKEYPNSIITIGAEQRVFKEKSYNVIYVHDTGPGIPVDVIPKLFGSFFTLGKEDGTGLGLAFCKRNMVAFDGDIICESEIGKWTKFSLLFPLLSEEELKLASVNLNESDKASVQEKTKILLVDDQEINLKVTKKKIEKALPNISCDVVLNGGAAIDLLKSDKNKYSLILLDIQMPHMGGIETAKEIRKIIDDSIPVIALTSLNYREFTAQLKANSQDNVGKVLGNFDCYLNKSSPANILYRTITKYLMQEDDLPYLGEEKEYVEILKGKKIILADDQEVNLIVTKKKLEQHGIKVDTVTGGKELVEKYKNSLESERSQYDMIITDINMQPFHGDEAAKEIRKIEEENKILHRNIIPIIALSGDGNKEDIYKYFDAQITDYFIKGNDPEILIKIIANYLKAVSQNEYGSDFNKVKEKQGIELTKEGSVELSDLNLRKLESLTHNNNEEIKKILFLFLSETKIIMTHIKENYVSGNIEGLHTGVHTLKGISNNIGADRLFSHIKETGLEIKDESFLKNENWLKELWLIYDNLTRRIEEVTK
ncbi:MAG: response regulator [Rickettsiales bacterium]|nr:response regulator [Rickettsiales bacterium]